MTASGASWLQSDSMTTSTFESELQSGLSQFKDDLDYAEAHAPQTSVKPYDCSIFDLYPPMPGVMTREEVERDIDLGSWKLELDGKIYPLNVSFYVRLTWHC